MGRLNLAVRFFFFPRPLHGAEVFRGEHQVFLGGLGFQGFEPFAKDP